ncbi:MAG: cupin domain-containing protein [Rubrivivax sp.]|nr:cupin domain-containing protein [Rubrivivax sp.]
MDVTRGLVLLGGLSPAAFIKRHWQRKPLLVRQAWPAVPPPLDRAALFALAAQDGVESRLVQRVGTQWRVRHGPMPRRALPPVQRPGWTLLLQGLDLHVSAAHAMLGHFRFVPDARLDDLMVSWASEGGGVGAHVDSYDVFLLQVQGTRRWQVGRTPDARWIDGAPLKLLANFVPEQEWLLQPGDMLYVPPGWGHDGVAVGGDCMTCSIGFRAPAAEVLAHDLLQRLADEPAAPSPLYRDAAAAATATPAAIPPALQDFARQALARRLAEPQWLERALGESLSEPKPNVWFEGPGRHRAGQGVQLSPRSRMLYDTRHIFINGEAFEARGRDARLMRQLADQRALPAAALTGLSAPARALLDSWIAAGWITGDTP